MMSQKQKEFINSKYLWGEEEDIQPPFLVSVDDESQFLQITQKSAAGKTKSPQSSKKSKQSSNKKNAMKKLLGDDPPSKRSKQDQDSYQDSLDSEGDFSGVPSAQKSDKKGLSQRLNVGSFSAREKVGTHIRGISEMSGGVIHEGFAGGAGVCESEKSQFTQESCSAAENESQEYSQRIVYTSESRQLQSGPSPCKHQLQIRDNPFKIAEPIESNLKLLGVMQGQNLNEQQIQKSENGEEFKEEKESMSGIGMSSSRSNNDMMTTEEMKNPLYSTFHNQQLNNYTASVAQQVRRRDSNSLAQSIQNSQNYLQSNEFNYSPDFKESASAAKQQIDANSGSLSPIQYLQRNSTFGSGTDNMRKPQSLPRDHEAHMRPVLYQKQTLLRYEEFEGDCQTSSSHQPNDPSGGLHGQIFFSGGSSVNHGGSLEFNRRQSERMSDLIYERGDQTVGSQSRNEEELFSPYNNTAGEENEHTSSEVQPVVSPSNLFERKMPSLSVITEEDTQNDHSVYYANPNRQTIGASNETGKVSSVDFMKRIITQRGEEEVHDYKSRSVPSIMPVHSLRGRQNSRRVSPTIGQGRSLGSQLLMDAGDQQRRSSLNRHGDELSASSFSQKNTINQYLLQPQQVQTSILYHKSYTNVKKDEDGREVGSGISDQRKSHDLRVQDVDGDDQIMRLHSAGLLRDSANGLGGQQNYPLISEEDLLSNIDRQSKLHLPPNDFISEDDHMCNRQHTPHSIKGEQRASGLHYAQYYEDQSLQLKVKEQALYIDQLKLQNEQCQSHNQELLEIIRSLEQKNAYLEGQNEELLNQLSVLNQPSLPQKGAEAAPSFSQQYSQPSLQSNLNEFEGTMSQLGGTHETTQVDSKSAAAKKGKERRGSARRKVSSNMKSTPKRDSTTEQVVDQAQLDLSKIVQSSVKEYETPSMRNKSKDQASQGQISQLEVQQLRQQLLREQQKFEHYQRTIEHQHLEQNQHKKQLLDELKEKEQRLQSYEAIQQKWRDKVKVEKENDERAMNAIMAERDEISMRYIEVLDILNQYRQKVGELNQTAEHQTSTTSLLPIHQDEEIQTDNIFEESAQHLHQRQHSKHARTPSHYSMGNTSKKEGSSLPHTIPLPELNSTYGDPHDNQYLLTGLPLHLQSTFQQQAQMSSHKQPSFMGQQFIAAGGVNNNTFAYQSYNGQQQQLNNSSGGSLMNPQSITIINNKQELGMLLELQKQYELRAIKLQTEISEHKNRLIRENQEITAINKALKDEFKLKLKNKAAKAQRYKAESQHLQNQNSELKSKIDQLQGKLSAAKVKFEAKIQEKEFKILMLKSQLKQLATFPNINQAQATPPTGIQQLNKVYSQNELLTIINSVIQNQTRSQQQQDEHLQNELNRSSYRPKSTELNSKIKVPFHRRDGSHHMDEKSFQSPDQFNLDISRFTRNESSQLLIPPSYSVKGSSGVQRQRRFENTMIFPPPGGMMSPPLVINNSNQHLPRSVPRMNYSRDHMSSEDFNFYMANQNRALSSKKQVSPRQAQVTPFEGEKKQDLFMEQKPFSFDVKQRPSQQVEIVDNLRERFQQRADNILQSRNKKREGNLPQGGSSGVMKSTFSDGDFMKRSFNREIEVDVFNNAALQKQCTTEMSNLVDEKIEDSRQRREQLEKSEIIPSQKEGYQSLQVEHVASRRGTSSYHSATFRKLSTHHLNSPQKNLSSQFDQATPVFIQPSPQMSRSAYVLDQDPNMYYSQIADDQRQANQFVINEQPFVQHQRIVPQNNLGSLGASSGDSRKLDYLKKLRIREKQSKSRQNQQQSNIKYELSGPKNQSCQLVDSLNEYTMHNPESYLQNPPKIIKNDNVAATQRQNGVNSILSQPELPLRPGQSIYQQKSSSSIQSKNSKQHLSIPQRPYSTLKQESQEQVSVAVISDSVSQQALESQETIGVVNHQYLTRQHSSNKMLSDQSEQAQQQVKLGPQSAKNTRLEDIKRYYGRKYEQ